MHLLTSNNCHLTVVLLPFHLQVLCNYAPEKRRDYESGHNIDVPNKEDFIHRFCPRFCRENSHRKRQPQPIINRFRRQGYVMPHKRYIQKHNQCRYYGKRPGFGLRLLYNNPPGQTINYCQYRQVYKTKNGIDI